jgi:hypothetical protein
VGFIEDPPITFHSPKKGFHYLSPFQQITETSYHANLIQQVYQKYYNGFQFEFLNPNRAFLCHWKTFLNYGWKGKSAFLSPGKRDPVAPGDRKGFHPSTGISGIIGFQEIIAISGWSLVIFFAPTSSEK